MSRCQYDVLRYQRSTAEMAYVVYYTMRRKEAIELVLCVCNVEMNVSNISSPYAYLEEILRREIYLLLTEKQIDTLACESTGQLKGKWIDRESTYHTTANDACSVLR